MNPEFATELVKLMMFQAVTLAAPILVTASLIPLLATVLVLVLVRPKSVSAGPVS